MSPARTGPRVLDDLSFLMKYSYKIPLIYGVWEPTLIKRPYRLTNYIYNIKNLVKLATIATERNMAYHVQSTFEYKIYKLFSKNVYLIPPCIDEFRLRDKDEKFTISFIYAEYRKGADIAFIVLDYFLRKFNDVRVNIVIGRGFLKSLFHALRIEHGNRVSLYNTIPRDSLYELLSRSHVLIFPSRWEVFGRVALESLACGTPVVAFDIPGAPHDILRFSECSYVAQPFNINEFMRGVLHYYSTWKKKPVVYENISRKCVEVAQRYSCKKCLSL
jgi:glycosyltransferase involved in cell wall biosynthesis